MIKARSHYTTITINCKHAIIGKKNCVSVNTTTKMIKLSFDDNDFKISHLRDFFSVERLISARIQVQGYFQALFYYRYTGVNTQSSIEF
jgi:hypothetical protein